MGPVSGWLWLAAAAVAVAARARRAESDDALFWALAGGAVVYGRRLHHAG